MSKAFNIAMAQQRATDLRRAMLGRRYQHWKGDIYGVVWVDVDEATGEPRVSYQSEIEGHTWSRPHADFIELVDGKPRFVLIGALEKYERTPAERAAFDRECAVVRAGIDTDDPPVEVDISNGARGVYAERYAAGHTVELINIDTTKCAGGCGASAGELLVKGHRSGCKLG